MPRKRKVLTPLVYPTRIQARYRRQLLAYTVDMRRETKDGVRRVLADPVLRRDGVEEMTQLLDTLRARFRGLWPDSRIRDMAGDLYDRLTTQVTRRFNAQWGEDLGLSSVPSGVSQQAQAAFVRQNVALIKSIDARYFDEIEGLVLGAVQSGARVETLRDQIRARYGVSRKRAALIARDQVGKAVGTLTRERQKSAGVEELEWSTSGDERVRRSHQKANGKLFKLEEGLLIDGVQTWPGLPIQCRCSSAPVLPDFG